MREHEGRYQSSPANQEGGRKRARPPRNRLSIGRQYTSGKKDKQMTYDDYLAQVKDADKIIDVDEDSKLDVAREVWTQYVEWLKQKRLKYQPIVIAKLRGAIKTVVDSPKVTQFTCVVKSKTVNSFGSLVRRLGRNNVVNGAITSTVVLVILGVFIASLSSSDSVNDNVAQGVDGSDSIQSSEGSVQGASARVEPSFDVVTPDDEPIQASVVFDPSVGVASFKDKIQDRGITVSQQPLTDEQKADKVNQLELISVSLSAEVSFETKFGTTYLTNVAPDGTKSQVVLFMTEELLVIMRSDGVTINPDAWVEYINTIE